MKTTEHYCKALAQNFPYVTALNVYIYIYTHIYIYIWVYSILYTQYTVYFWGSYMDKENFVCTAESLLDGDL